MANSLIQKIKTSDVYDGTYTQNLHELIMCVARQDVTNFENFDANVHEARMYFIRNRSGYPTSNWNYAPGLLLKPTATESLYILINLNTYQIALKKKQTGTWDENWKTITPV